VSPPGVPHPDDHSGTDERGAQRAYWKEHSAQATVESMMLDSQAKDIDRLERPEVLSLLGSTDGKRIVELGAGIGRFTADIAQGAKSVIAIDFMQNLIDQNKAINGHMENIEFRCGDATLLELEPSSLDVVFSNWLLMYLADAEVENLAVKMLKWLDNGGVVFFRESCFRQSGDRSRSNNPTHYRNPREYFRIFDNAKILRSDGGYDHFELVVCKSVDTYVRVKQNQNQVCWKWRKVSAPSASSNDLRHFLDSQYSHQGISKYQLMFGDGFVSPGGIQTTEEFSKLLEVKTDDAVLDVGCGVGGAAMYIAKKYGCYVYGVDLSVNMIMCALENAAASMERSKVSFEVSDAAKRDLSGTIYDAIFSRDVFFYIQDKGALFSNLYKALKPGGRLVFTDYCQSEKKQVSGEFEEYVSMRGYSLTTLEEYKGLLSAAGFKIISAEDRSNQLIGCIESELKKVRDSKNIFEDALGAENVVALESSWVTKLRFVKEEEHAWGLFVVTK